MATYSKIDTNSPVTTRFALNTSGNSTGDFEQTLVTVPTGFALVIQHIWAGPLCIINHITGPSGYKYRLALTASTKADFTGIVLPPGTYTLHTSLSGSYGWDVMGYYVTLNT